MGVPVMKGEDSSRVGFESLGEGGLSDSMKRFEDLKTILEIIVILAALAEYPLLLVTAVVVVWMYVLINDKDIEG
jgi:hypothetical protein